MLFALMHRFIKCILLTSARTVKVNKTFCFTQHKVVLYFNFKCMILLRAKVHELVLHYFAFKLYLIRAEIQ